MLTVVAKDAPEIKERNPTSRKADTANDSLFLRSVKIAPDKRFRIEEIRHFEPINNTFGTGRLVGDALNCGQMF